MLDGFFDFTKPVGFDETAFSIVIVVGAMWAGFMYLKALKRKENEK